MKLFLLLLLLLPASPLCIKLAAQNVSSSLVHGVVIDPAGSPIAGARIAVKQKSRLIGESTTGTSGQFEIPTHDLHDLTLLIDADGFAAVKRHFDNLNSNNSLRIQLNPSPISAQVTVAANRIETRLSETAASVVTLTSGDLKTTAAATLDDALRQVPGFSLFRRSGSRTANPTSQGVSLRGVGASGASRALVLSDGVPLNDPFGGWVYWDRVPRESIAQVEVLQGPASHLYGDAALGGVIDITSAEPKPRTISLAASYGNETTPNASVYMSNVWAKWGASLSAEDFRTDGYVLVPEDQRGAVDTAAGVRDATLNLQLERSCSDGSRVFSRAAFFGESRKNGTPLQTNRTHIRQFVIGGDWHNSVIGAINVRAYGGTQVFDQNFSSISADRQTETLTRVQRVPAQIAALSVNWSRIVGSAQTLVAGGEIHQVRGSSDEIAYSNGLPTSYVGAGGRERAQGVYGEDLFRFGKRFFLSVGGRYDHWENYAALLATRPITSPSPTNVSAFPDRVQQAFSPHASAVYILNEHVSLLASAARAFRAPTLNELYRSFRVGNILTLANENLRAERLTGGEVGARVMGYKDRLGVRAAIFWNDINRPVANVTLITTQTLITRQRQNLGSTRSNGVELLSDARLNSHWTVSAGYLFADATVVRFPANTNLEGLRIPQVPRHLLTFQVRYANPKLTFALQGRASSSQFEDDQNLLPLDPYLAVDAYVSRRLSNWSEIFVAAENVFDRQYEVGKTPVTTLGPPILIRAGFRLNFGSK